MSVTQADCELLGRGPVQGSADSDSLAALVRQLYKQQQRGRLPGRRCTVSCSRDAGLEIVPYQRKRPDDEGFESDEDLASLGSYEEPGKRKIGTLAAASVAAGAGSDSANSSGVSEDSDDADAASLKGAAVAGTADMSGDGGGAVGTGGREAYGLSDVAFCHTDAATLPGIAVWVIKNRLRSGLEAIVIRSRDNRLADVCRAYQEHSRRLKLEPKPWTSSGGQPNGQSSQQRRKVISGGSSGGGGSVTLTATPEVNRYNLVQRTDTDGVTHIEVTTGPVAPVLKVSGTASSPDVRRVARDHGEPPSSIISISTPESPRLSRADEGPDGGRAATGDELPPQRPERRKYKAKVEGGGVSDGVSGDEDFRRQQKVVRGQFIRVNVNHVPPPPTSLEPERKPPVVAVAGHQESGKSSAVSSTTGSVSDRLWSTADYDRLDGRYEHHVGRQSRSGGSRTRSRSTGPGRRQQLLTVPPVTSNPPPVAFSRYQNVEQPQQQSSFGTRFFGKLREITSGNQSPPPLFQDLQPVAFRRRNSVGESAATNFYQYFGHHHYQHNQHHNLYQQQQPQQHHQHQKQQQQQHRQQVRQNGGNLKSVIKKSNKSSQPYQHTFDEPKKVTFSAYATVQVVD